MSKTIRRLSVAGAGFMGHGIAQVAATAGIAVSLYDIHDEALAAARERIAWSLGKLQSKGKLSETPEEILSRIRLTRHLEELRFADLLIEVAPEREEIKIPLHQKLDALCGPDTILASNTSCIPISTLAAATRRGDRFCGIHFFSPVVLMKLVEVIRGRETSEQTMETALAFVEQVGKDPVRVEKDTPGFIVNRILLPGGLEAVRLVEAGIADPATIDKAMKLGSGAKMGPLETIDMTGVDVLLGAADVLFQHTGNPMFKPPELIRRMVAEGKLGVKTGQGFYTHAPPAAASAS